MTKVIFPLNCTREHQRQTRPVRARTWASEWEASAEHSSKDLLQQLIRNLYHTTILPYGSQRLIIDETLKKHSEIFERLALRKK